MNQSQCLTLAHEIADLLQEAGCDTTDAIKIASRFVIAAIMGQADTRETALDGWAALTDDARRMIVMHFDEASAEKQKMRNNGSWN